MKQESGLWKFLRSLAGSRQPVHGSAAETVGDSAPIAIAPDARVSLHDGGIAFLNIATGKLFLSNETGSRIWQGVVAGMNMDAIAGKISQECGVGWDLVRRQTSSFVMELESRGLIIRKAQS